MEVAGECGGQGKVMKCVSGRVVRKEGEENEQTTELLPGLPDHLALRCLANAPLASLWRVSKRWRSLLSESRYFQALRRDEGKSNPTWLYCMVRVMEEEEVEVEGSQSEGGGKEVGGSFCWLAFDPLAGRWHELPGMPQKVDFQLSSPSMIGVSHSVQTQSTGDKLVVVAGMKKGPGEQLEPALDRPILFDIKKMEWRVGTPFRVPRKWCTCGVAGGKIFVASGCGQQWEDSISKSAEMYDPERDVWQPVSNLSTSKMSGEAMNAVNVGGNLHLASGNGIFLRSGLVFNPVTGSWSKMDQKLIEGWGPQTVAIDGRFFCLDNASGRLESFDAVEGRWKLRLEDPRLQRMKHVIGSMGKLCGSVLTDGGLSILRVVDVTAERHTFRDLAVPKGQVVAVQIADACSSPQD